MVLAVTDLDVRWTPRTKAIHVTERNALICAANLFLYLVLHRLVDIQTQLHTQRAVAKAAAPGAPMNKVPMGTKID